MSPLSQNEPAGSAIIFADKPSGLTTHASTPDTANARGQAGLAEYLSDRLESKLLVVHRLDRGTTGAILFAQNPEIAEHLRGEFAARRVQKSYLFVTDRPQPKDSKLSVISRIERRGNTYVTEPPVGGDETMACTHFQPLKESGGFTLWQAKPETGRPHQIRLHAQHLAIPILGDCEHGGSSFPALCLHSEKIAFSWQKRTHLHESPAPIWLQNLALLSDSDLVRWLASIDRRQRWLRSLGQSPEPDATLRWIHTDGDPLRVDQFGDVFWLSWYRDSNPNEVEWQRLRKLTSIAGWSNAHLQLRGKKAAHEQTKPLALDEAVALPESWQGKESGLYYRFRAESGFSPGLFLDQRQNRSWLRREAQGRSVLNLFCYTGGFSVAAARGQASQVVSVDLSKKFLAWAGENFALNGLDEGNRFKFRAMDSFDYLTWAIKKNLQFDLVICDPPSFSRNGRETFSIDRDFSELALKLWRVTAAGGRILFASNFEQWTESDLLQRWRRLLEDQRLQAEILLTPMPDLDFELPGEPPLMKSLIVHKTQSKS